MLFRILLVLLSLSLAVAAEDRLAEYYQRAVPSAERFCRRFDQEEPTDDFTIFTLFDNIAILVSANADLPEGERPSLETVTKLLRIAETMQDRNLESRTFGNFRWYWSSTGVTDPNAAEFAVARMLSVLLDTPSGGEGPPISDEARDILEQLLEYSVTPCLNRRIRPDYTNIALYNATHLILLGQVLDSPEVSEEGKRRLQNIVAAIWEHGIFEYNSPSYYFINVDALQLAYRHVKNEQVRQMIHALLELFWTDLSLHWFSPGLRLAGAQSRMYNYLYGTNDHMFRLFAFAGLGPYDHNARYHAMLNSFRAQYQPPKEIVALNAQYPRWTTRNWGQNQGQWATMYMFEDIALGTAGAKYDTQQNMVQVIDMPDPIAGTPTRFKPRSYFIADGREDPYGTKLSPTGSGGQQKALHLDALWFGAQRTVDSLGIALYPPEAIKDPTVINVQSHFVVRKPESIWVGDESITLSPHQPCNVGNQPVVFRYETCAFGVRAVWARQQNGQPAEVFLVDDENEHEVYRLTVRHHKIFSQKSGDREEANPFCANDPLAGTAFWIRIGSHIETDDQFTTWRQQFMSATVNRLIVNNNDIDIEVAGQDGIVAVQWVDSVVTTEPAAPLGILTFDGRDLGRPILERIPEVAQFAKQLNEVVPIIVEPSGTYWDVETGYSFSADWLEPDASASGGLAARINDDVSWKLQIEQPEEYYLWGRVKTIDDQHDSFFVETARQLPDSSFMRRSFQANWQLGTRTIWTWVRLPMPILLEEGVWQLTLKPREYDGQIDQFFLTSDPGKLP